MTMLHYICIMFYSLSSVYTFTISLNAQNNCEVGSTDFIISNL